MANTWRATSQAVALSTAAAKDLLNVFNGGASARIIRVYRCWHFNGLGTTAVTPTSAFAPIAIYRITAASVGSAVTPVSHDPANSALDAATTAGTGQTVTTSDQFRKYMVSPDEPDVASGSGIDEWQTMVPIAEIWNSGYGESNIQPLVCRATQGVSIYQTAAITMSAGTAVSDLEIEFTDAGS